MTKPFDRPLSPARRMLTLFGLVGLTMGVATLRGPARGADDGPSPAAKAVVSTARARDPSRPSWPPYVRDDMDGVVCPSRSGLSPQGDGPVLALIQKCTGRRFRLSVAKELKVDTSRPGFLKLRCQDIEWITAGIGFDRSPTQSQRKATSPTGEADEPMHRISVGSSGGPDG